MPVFVGRPAEGYPWPFFGSALLPGREACDVPLDDPARAAVGSQLALFLKRLHSAEVADEARAHELPVDVVRRADMGYRVPKTRAQLKELAELGLWQAPPHVGELLEAALRLPPATPSGIAHGDLHFRHLLLDGDARLTGVIDWIDVCRADPAIDLQLLWSFVPPSGRRSFLEAYGPATEPQLLRARVLALFLCASLARYGHAEGATSVEREALGGLDRAVAD
jgi:aminoglycoside phosphotransferase (APT) family kinase protein